MLEARGVLGPEELHKLATKTRKGMSAEVGKGSCHSDLVPSETAKALQGRLVQLRTKDAEPAE